MKTWAEKRRRDMEAMGVIELARMFELIVRICEMEEEVQANAGKCDDLGW